MAQKREPAGGKLAFSLHTGKDQNVTRMHFRFCQEGPLPGRVNALTGHSGSGKSEALVRLAMKAGAGPGRARPWSADLMDPSFSRVMAVSHTGLDRFPVKMNEKDGPEYLYLGLRKEDEQGGRNHKSSADIAQEAAAAARSVSVNLGHAALESALAPLGEETSIRRTGFDPGGVERPPDPGSQIGLLSAAQQLAVGTTLGMTAFLRPGSLVLLDTPEAHMHPSLLAAFMQSVRWTLEERRSYAIIATSSPVALQEIPGRCVQTLSRHGGRTKVSGPAIETFGEGAGLIMTQVLGLETGRSGYPEILREMAERNSDEEIDAMFERGLSAQARALVMAQTAGRERGRE